MERQIAHQTDIRDEWVIKIINKYKAIKSHNAKCALTLAIIKIYWFNSRTIFINQCPRM